jgi:non-ribosomal peptide synthetase component F
MSTNQTISIEGAKVELPYEYETVQDLLKQLLDNADNDQWTCGILNENILDCKRLARIARDISHVLIPYNLVTICMQPSIEFITVLCGIIVRGIPYVPLEPNSPPERLKYILNDSQSSLIIIDDPMLKLKDIILGTSRILTYAQLLEKSTVNENIPTIKVKRDDTFCLMYTSGSTGDPKAVIIPHRAIVNRLYWQWSTFPFKVNDICCLKTSISFVDSIAELLAPLLRQVPIVILPKSLFLDVDLLSSTLAVQRISRIVLVPSLFVVLLNYLRSSGKSLPDLDTIVCSGETLSLSLIEFFFEMKHQFSCACRLLNFYGSTEVMADATYEIFDSIDHLHDKLSFEGHTSIGSPIDNIIIQIRDTDERNVGELYVMGEGVANGYYFRDAITDHNLANKFIRGNDGILSFRTGDIGKMYNGRIIYYGRNDYQVDYHYYFCLI